MAVGPTFYTKGLLKVRRVWFFGEDEAENAQEVLGTGLTG